jgi:hypothetical protein
MRLSFSEKIKIKVSVCLINHHAVETYEGVEIRKISLPLPAIEPRSSSP